MPGLQRLARGAFAVRVDSGDDEVVVLLDCDGLEDRGAALSRGISGLGLSTVDAVLLSSTTCVIGLPYLTEVAGYDGPIFASEPTAALGELLLEAVAEREAAVERTAATSLRAPCVTPRCAARSVSRIVRCNYGEAMELKRGLFAVASSCGLGVGSSCWSLYLSGEDRDVRRGTCVLVYVPKCNGASDRACTPLDLGALPRAARCLVMKRCEGRGDAGRQLSNACDCIVTCERALVPVALDGVLFLDILEGVLRSVHPAVTVFIVSTIAERLFLYLDGAPEWLSRPRRLAALSGAPPFDSVTRARERGALRCMSYPDAELLRATGQRCIVLCDDPAELLQAWCGDNRNCVVFVEPEIDIVSALAPFQPVNMAVAYRPVELGLSADEAQLLKTALRAESEVVV